MLIDNIGNMLRRRIFSMKKKVFLAASIAFLVFNSTVLAKNITLDELQSSQANFKPAVNITAKEVNSGHWAYKSLENITRKYGLLVGDANEKFDGSKPLTRNEAAVILVNLIGKVEQEKINIDQSEKVQIDILKNELSEEITALTGRVAILEDSVGKLQGSVSNIEKNNSKTLKTGYGEDFKIGGTFQFKYNGNFKKGADNYSPNFSVPYSELKITGKMAPHVNYVAQMLPYRTWNNAYHSTSTTPTVGSILADAYISTDILPHHVVYFGQSRIPIGVEGQIGVPSLDTIDRAQIARNFSNYRDSGVKIAGKWSLFDYTIGAFSGSGENYKDYNNSMGVGGWLTAKPLHKLPQYGKLEIGGGYYRQGVGNSTNTALSSRYEAQTYGTAIGYKYKKHSLKSEFAYRKGYSSIDRTARGLFTQYMYDINKKYQLLAKVDTFDPNVSDINGRVSAGNARNTEYTIGANYLPAGNNIKLQVNAVYVNNLKNTDSVRLMALTQYMF